MADGTIEIDVKVNAGDLKSEVSGKALAAGKAAGEEIENGVEKGGAKGGKAAGEKVKDGVEKGGAKGGKAAGEEIEAEVEKGARDGAEGAAEELGGIGGKLKGAFAAAGIGAAVGAAAAAMGELAAEAAETEKFMSRLEASAEKNGISAEVMERSYSDLVGVIGETDRAVETANNAFALCGESQEELEGLTVSLTGAFAQFGDSLPIESLAESANETAKVGVVTGNFADALNWVNASTDDWNKALRDHPKAMNAFNAALESGMSAEDAFNAALAKCTSEQERQQLVLETLNALYGESGEKYLQANNALIEYNKSQDRFKQALSDVGTALMPVVSDVTGFAASLLENLAPALETGISKLGEFAQSVIDNVSPVLQEFWENVAPDAEKYFGSLKETADKIGQAFVGLGEQLAPVLDAVRPILEDFAGLIYDIGNKASEVFGEIVPPIIEAAEPIIRDALSKMVKDLRSTFNEMDASWQEFKPKIDEFVTWFKETFVAAIEEALPYISGFVSLLSGIGDTINNTVLPALQTFWDFLNQYIFPVLDYLGDKFWEKFQIVAMVVGIAKDKIQEFASNAKKFFEEDVPNAINRMWEFFNEIPGRIKSALDSSVSNIAGFASSCLSKAKEAGSNFLRGIQDGFNRAVEFVQSIPQRIANAIGNLGGTLVGNGRALMDGLLRGIREAAQNVYDFVSGIAGRIASLKGPIPYDLKLLIPNGKAIMKSLESGLEKGFVPVMANVKGIAGEIADGVGTAALGNKVAASLNGALGVRYNRAYEVSSAVTNSHVVNEGDKYVFNQPIKTPRDVAREIRMAKTYGLAASRARG